MQDRDDKNRTELQRSPTPLKAAGLKKAFPDLGRVTQFHCDSARLAAPRGGGGGGQQQVCCRGVQSPPEAAQLFLAGK